MRITFESTIHDNGRFIRHRAVIEDLDDLVRTGGASRDAVGEVAASDAEKRPQREPLDPEVIERIQRELLIEMPEVGQMVPIYALYDVTEEIRAAKFIRVYDTRFGGDRDFHGREWIERTAADGGIRMRETEAVNA